MIGCSYASIFMALGGGRSRGRRPRFPPLRLFYAEISERLREAELRHAVFRVHSDPQFLRVHDSPTKSGRGLETEAALFAAGRRAAVDGLELQNAGLGINDKGYIPVDQHYRTNVPNIYAAGSFPVLASTSMEQGRLFAPCLRPQIQATCGFTSPYGHLHYSRNFRPPEKRKRHARKENRLRGGPRPLRKQCSWPHSRRYQRFVEVGLCARRQKTFGRQHHWRECYRAHSHRYDGRSTAGTIDEFIEQVFNYPTVKRINTPPTMAWVISRATSSAKASLPRGVLAFCSAGSIVTIFYFSFRRCPRHQRIGIAGDARGRSTVSAVARPQNGVLGFDRNLYPGDAAFATLRKTFSFPWWQVEPIAGEAKSLS